MTATAEHFYTYYSYEEWGRGYLGSRGSAVPPEEDDYFGSFSDETFNPTQKVVLSVHTDRESAYLAEVALHDYFDVANNPHFANKSKAKPGGFLYSPLGKTVWNKDGVVKTFDKDPGEGWERGFPETHTRESKHKGKTLWHDPETNEAKFFMDEPPEGWVLGSPPTWEVKGFTKENNPCLGKTGEEHPAGGTSWWFNSETKETRRSVLSPGEGWEERRGETGPRPDVSLKNVNCSWFTDGKTERFCEVCPNGWRKGRLYNPNSQLWKDPFDGHTGNAGSVATYMRKHGRDPSLKVKVS